MGFQSADIEIVYMRLFPFSLAGKAKDWLRSLPNQSLISWKDVEEKYPSLGTIVTSDKHGALVVESHHACPKDSYPLPNFDQLVDGAANHKILSFLDAYSGYNQISIHPRDKEKTTFMTVDANYYYEVMSFSLKNTGATYQWVMDKIFQGLIGWCVEVYVDDIVVKSDSFDRHIKDLGEVYKALRGAIICPGWAITDIQNPKNIKEVQQLIGCLTTSLGSSPLGRTYEINGAATAKDSQV